MFPYLKSLDSLGCFKFGLCKQREMQPADKEKWAAPLRLIIMISTWFLGSKQEQHPSPDLIQT